MFKRILIAIEYVFYGKVNFDLSQERRYRQTPQVAHSVYEAAMVCIDRDDPSTAKHILRRGIIDIELAFPDYTFEYNHIPPLNEKKI
jgi:hypothetical protein